jgi:hypothetical protein
MAAVLKTAIRGDSDRGFESHALRSTSIFAAQDWSQTHFGIGLELAQSPAVSGDSRLRARIRGEYAEKIRPLLCMSALPLVAQAKGPMRAWGSHQQHNSALRCGFFSSL